MYSFLCYLKVFVFLSGLISERDLMEPAGWEMDFSISQENFPTLILKNYDLFISPAPRFEMEMKFQMLCGIQFMKKNISDVSS